MNRRQDAINQTATKYCHENPLHFPGLIQPHGVILALSIELEILQVSNNTEEYLSLKPQDLLGQHLEILLDAGQIAVIKQRLAIESNSIIPFKLVITTSPPAEKAQRVKCSFFYCIVHQIENIVILELEPADSQPEMSFLAFQSLTYGAIAKMQKASDITEFLHVVVSELRKITEFDRVMVYQFDHQGSGCVIAESKKEDLSPYFGLHYPATDIPEASRELYKECSLRFIPNIHAEPVPIITRSNSTAEPLNLSLSVLRGTNPCAVEFHQNMGVKSLFVLPIIQEQKLWGLISCHNYSPKSINCEMRKVCEYLGQIISRELGHKVSQSESNYKFKLKSLLSEFIESISQADNFIDALIKPEIRLLDIVNATGAAVFFDNEITLVGATPNIEDIRNLISWADSRVKDNLFYTDLLPKLYPEAEAFKDTASGLLLLQISQIRRYYILWFRPEVLQTVNWAGNPNDSINLQDDGTVTLSPRKSFAQWQEIVKLTSLPWKECEIDIALDFRNAIVGIVLHKAEELAAINLELERSNRELASFAFAASHDLKEPLRGIHNYSTVLLEDYAHLLDEEGMDCLQTLITLSQRMDTLIDVLLQISQLGQAELKLQKTNLNNVLRKLIEMLDVSRQDEKFDIRMTRALPEVECDPVLINQVFSNLIINAFKYNESAEKWVEIGYLDKNEQLENGLITDTKQEKVPPIFYVKDNGIGIHEHHLETIFRLFKRLHSQEKYGGGAGAGLAITKKIVERHHGRIWVESTYGLGSTFYFTLESLVLSK